MKTMILVILTAAITNNYVLVKFLDSSYRSPASSRASRASGLSSCSMMQASSRRA